MSGFRFDQIASGPEFATDYKFTRDAQPTINGRRVPWLIYIDGPRIEPIEDGTQMHILWVPVIVDKPMPPLGTPDAELLLLPEEDA